MHQQSDYRLTAADAEDGGRGTGGADGVCGWRRRRLLTSVCVLLAAACAGGVGLAGLASRQSGTRVLGRMGVVSGLSGELKTALFKRRQRSAPAVAAQPLDGAFDRKTPSPSWCPGYTAATCPRTFPLPYPPCQYPEAYDYNGSFPKDFVWGMGTAAHQVEGAYREDGRGASIWDTFSGANTVGMPGANCSYCCMTAPCQPNAAMAEKGATGNVACDHYHMWRSDIALMRSMGLKHYRFSISWSRVIPTGKKADGVNQKGIDFYNDLIDGLLEAGIQPTVTLYHWDLPQGLLDPPREQGWWSRDKHGRPDGKIMADWLDYATLCFETFGDRVKTWFTFNEPWTFLYLGSGWGKAPSIAAYSNMKIDPLIGAHNVLNAHAAAVHLYRRRFQPSQRGQIGITNNCDWREPMTILPQDIAAAERALITKLGWFADPIFGEHGDYPPEMRELFGDRLPEFTPAQRKLLRNSSDFFGLNHYGTGFVTFNPDVPGEDMSYSNVLEDGYFPKGQSSWLYGSGWGFRKQLNWIARRYNNPPLYVSEAGWSLAGTSARGSASDRSRVMYYANYTAEMRKAIYEDKVDVRGFYAWSLMDNYEWGQGYTERFGTVYTEYMLGSDPDSPPGPGLQPTAGRQWRRRKDSSCWLEVLFRTNALVDPADESLSTCPNSTVFSGVFLDSTTNCPRTIAVVGGRNVSISGRSLAPGGAPCDGGGGAGDAAALDEARVPGFVSGGTLVANFSGVGGAESDLGYWDGASHGIRWASRPLWKRTEPMSP